MGRTILLSVVLLLMLAFVIGCAAGPNSLVNSPDDQKTVAGFWKGLWHGFIMLFTFIISLFNHNIQIYEVHNSGIGYNFGYLLGAMIFFSGGGRGSKRRSKR